MAHVGMVDLSFPPMRMILPEVNGIMNNRKNAALGYVSPSDLLDAFEEDDAETVDKATDTMRKRAGQRRGPGGTATAPTPCSSHA